MARYPFGGTLADFIVSDGGGGTLNIEPNTDVKFYDALTGGTQYTSLIDASSNEVDLITSDAEGGIPEFDGPEGVVFMYADASAGVLPRKIIFANDTAVRALQNELALASANSAISDLQAHAPVAVYRDANTGDWPARPATTSPVWWVETKPDAPSAPTITTGFAFDGLDYYFGSV